MLAMKMSPRAAWWCGRAALSTTSRQWADHHHHHHHQKPDWNRAVSEAEKIVGYPTSFLSLRWLLSDEIANVAIHLRKLVGSNHPLLKTAKGLLYNGKNNMQAWGLIVLLLSKATGQAEHIPELEQDKSAGVMHSQRALAEVTEMIRTSHLVHKGLVNLRDSPLINDNNMTFGNKMALLTGDYLLGNSCAQLASLRNHHLVEIISSAVKDLSEAEFVGPRDLQNNPFPAPPSGGQAATLGPHLIDHFGFEPYNVAEALGHARSEWTLRHVLGAASLLGKACQGALLLAGHPTDLQKRGYLFGKHLALAWQACVDHEPFQPKAAGPFSLVCAPLMFQLEHDPSLYSEIEKGCDSVDEVDFDLIRRTVRSGPGLEKTQQLQREHSQAAMEVLNQLPQTDARQALSNIILAMQDL